MRPLSIVRCAALVCSVAIVASNGGGQSAPRATPAPLAVLDPMFDLSAVPSRPPMAGLATLDTNDAHEYYDAGMAAIDTNQAAASAAFYWASRIDPSWAEPYYARWYVLRRAEPRAVSDSVRLVVDSLYTLALDRDPFVDEQISFQNRGSRLIARWYFLFSGRRFDLASEELARLIRKYPDALQAYVYRAKATYYLRQYDTTAAILQAAIGRIDLRDTSRLLQRYFSRTIFTYALGLAYQLGHRDSAATAAFQRTLTENLGFYMAHLHLGVEALATHDTATAISEARLAAEIQPNDPAVQLFLGSTLLKSGHASEAVGPLRAAIAADPYYAWPYYYLGQACEGIHDTAGALAGYRGYLARAKRRESLREDAERAISRLGGT